MVLRVVVPGVAYGSTVYVVWETRGGASKSVSAAKEMSDLIV